MNKPFVRCRNSSFAKKYSIPNKVKSVSSNEGIDTSQLQTNLKVFPENKTSVENKADVLSSQKLQKEKPRSRKESYDLKSSL